MNETGSVVTQTITQFSDDVFNTLELLDKQTLNHSLRVRNIANSVVKNFGFNDDLLSQAALVHDIGKIYISSKILNKPSKLTMLERNIVNLHSYYGYRLLKDLGVSDEICYIVLYHHGTNVMALEDIPRCEDKLVKDYASILHTIDSYEALVSERVFRKKYTQEEALAILHSEKEHQNEVLKFLASGKAYI